MMALAADANKDLDKAFGKDHPHLKVTCFTCHHGNYRPETLADALFPVIKKDGADAATARYRELREEYYGTAAYDFSEYSLVGVAEELGDDPAQVASARALLNLNLEFYPESSTTYAHLAETYVAAGDTATAMTHFEKALSLAPDNERLKQRIEAVRSGKK
jgi:tetratricopeptide (TPR) repeat protein